MSLLSKWWHKDPATTITVHHGDEVKTVEVYPRETSDEIREKIEKSFKLTKDQFLNGLKSKEGVYRPYNRLFLEEGEYEMVLLDGVAGWEARESWNKQRALINWKHDVVRRRWRDGYRKCSRCGIMYQISQNGPTSCEFEDFGFNEKHGGRYKFKRKGEHSMALPRYPVDARIVDDIKISAGAYGAGALDQAEVAGIIGPSNEMISGWVPDDFLELPGYRPTKPGEEGRCLLM